MYEVFALKYGERDTTKCQFFYRESSHDKLTLDYFVWLILGGPQPLLVDTGLSRRRRAGPRHPQLREPGGDGRARAGSSPPTCRSRSSPTCTTTTGPATACSRTRSSGSRARKSRSGPGRSAGCRRSAAPPTSRRLAHLTTLNYGEQDPDRRGRPRGVAGHSRPRVGGHTAGLQIVSVETRRGTVVLTSDASHFYHNVETRQPVQIITSLPEMLTAFDTIDRLAGSDEARRRGPRPASRRALQCRSSRGSSRSHESRDPSRRRRHACPVPGPVQSPGLARCS